MMTQVLRLRAIQMKRMMKKKKINLAAKRRRRSQLTEEKTVAMELTAKTKATVARAEKTANATTQMNRNQQQQTKRAQIMKKKRQNKWPTKKRTAKSHSRSPSFFQQTRSESTHVWRLGTSRTPRSSSWTSNSKTAITTSWPNWFRSLQKFLLIYKLWSWVCHQKPLFVIPTSLSNFKDWYNSSTWPHCLCYSSGTKTNREFLSIFTKVQAPNTARCQECKCQDLSSRTHFYIPGAMPNKASWVSAMTTSLIWQKVKTTANSIWMIIRFYRMQKAATMS